MAPLRVVLPVIAAAAADASESGPRTPSEAPVRRGLALGPLVSAVRRLSVELYRPERRGRAVLWSVFVIFLALASTLYAVGMSVVLRLFWNALSAKDPAKFAKLMKLYGLAVVVGPVVNSTFDWAKGRLALLWRSALTEKYLKDYFQSGAVPYYQIATGTTGAVAGSMDNPDQRLTDDIRTFTERAVRFLCVFGVAIFDLAIFSVILFRIYPPLLLALIAYAVVGTVFVSLYGKSLVGLNSAQLQREADYRFSLLRVRDNAESIAFYRGEENEKSESLRRFGLLFENAIRLLGKSRNVTFVATSWRYWCQVVPSLIMGPAYFAGKIVLGAISQTMFSFNHVLSSMGLMVTEFVALSEFGAGVRRLDRLAGAINAATNEDDAITGGTVGITTELAEPGAAPGIQIRQFSLQTPVSPRRPLVQNLNVDVDPGQRLLLCGVSGIGKTSLLRAIAGLWKAGVGSVSRPAESETMFLPQRPFLSLGSLRDNVLYGSQLDTVPDEDVLAALTRVNLPDAALRMGGLAAAGEDVGRRLSLGEQQRLAFARVLVAKPKCVLLDESTSALDADNEKLMYDILRELGVTCVSVGNQASLPKYHDVELRLQAEGQWKLSPLEQGSV